MWEVSVWFGGHWHRRCWYQRCSNELQGQDSDKQICRRQASLPGQQRCPATHVALQQSQAELGKQSKVQRKEGRVREALCRAVPIVWVTLLSNIPYVEHNKLWPTWGELWPMCPHCHIRLHLLPWVFISFPTTEGSLQTSQEFIDILSSSEHPPHTEVTWVTWQLTTPPVVSRVMKGHSHFELPPERLAELGYLDVSHHFKFPQLWALKSNLPSWPGCL